MDGWMKGILINITECENWLVHMLLVANMYLNVVLNHWAMTTLLTG